MTIKEFYADRVIDFIKKHGPHITAKAKIPVIKSIILKHMDYETIVVLWDNGSIVGVCSFNVNGEVADVLECIVHPDYRRKNLLRKMTLIALERWPHLTRLQFQRGLRNDGRTHTIEFNKFLKLEQV